MSRKQHGMMCSEILDIRLESKSGRRRELKVNIEEIWSSGALFQTDARLSPFTPLWFACGGREFRGKVIARTFFRGLGYFVEMRFDPGCRWSEKECRPKHLFNPLILLANRIFEATLLRPSSQPDGLRLPAPF